jgi:hypothetical protein
MQSNGHKLNSNYRVKSNLIREYDSGERIAKAQDITRRSPLNVVNAYVISWGYFIICSVTILDFPILSCIRSDENSLILLLYGVNLSLQ